MFHFIDYVISLNKFGDFLVLIYSIEFEIKDTTDTARSTSGLDLCLEIDSEFPLRTIEALRQKR